MGQKRNTNEKFKISRTESLIYYKSELGNAIKPVLRKLMFTLEKQEG